ncbi:MAG: nuclear transport factor 2 family protein [Alphaproteobacteria bacterium]
MNDAVLAERWYAAWNAHDLDAILALYADDIEFSSPYIAALGFAADGVIEDKNLLRAYFELGLARAPEMRFIPESLCVGARGHTLIFRTDSGVRVAEHHQTNTQGLIVRAEATYEAV